MTPDVPDGSLQPSAAPPAAQKLSWREQRWQRRRRRKAFEEVLGWIFVPLIVGAVYWGLTAALDAAGTSPAAIVQGLQLFLSGGGQTP